MDEPEATISETESEPECQHLFTSVTYVREGYAPWSQLLDIKRGLLSWKQKRHATVARCIHCSDYLSLGVSSERAAAYVGAQAARVASTARAGALGLDELGVPWPAGVVMGWTLHEEAMTTNNPFDVDRQLTTNLRKVGYLARQIYTHDADVGRRLSVEGQRTFVGLLERYGRKK